MTYALSRLLKLDTIGQGFFITAFNTRPLRLRLRLDE
jgi:hypothetical protein